MTDSMLIPIKLLFLLGFTLHNLEESVWLPEWSKHAKKFHEPVERNQFIFAVIIITTIGYLVTLINILFNQPGNIANYMYLGFIGMMGINAIFPHLIATLVLKRYAPGLLTGILLNLPIACVIIIHYFRKGINGYYFILSMIMVTGIILFSLRYFFKLGEKLIKF
jgi:drug/metabolite transporter (DMT)-like permease